MWKIWAGGKTSDLELLRGITLKTKGGDHMTSDNDPDGGSH